MKLFSWFKRKERLIPESESIKIEVSTLSMFSPNVSCIKCFATNCYFNRYYCGEIGCDLKEIDIDNSGKCQSFSPRAKTAKFIQENAK